MVESKSEHIKYYQLCSRCKKKADEQGKIIVKDICYKCKRKYYKNADKKKKQTEMKRVESIDATSRPKSGSLVNIHLKALKKKIRKEILENKVLIKKEKISIRLLKKKIKNTKIAEDKIKKLAAQKKKIDEILKVG